MRSPLDRLHGWLLRPLRDRLLRVLAALVRVALGAGGWARPLVTLAWRSPGVVAQVVERADAAGVERLLAAAPRRPAAAADVALVRALHDALAAGPAGEDGGLDADHDADQQDADAALALADRVTVPAHAASPGLRRVVADRLVDLDQCDAAWTVLAVPPEVSLPDARLQLLVRGLVDVARLEAVIDQTAARLQRRSRQRSTVRVQREALLRRGLQAFLARDDEETLRWVRRAHEEVGSTVQTLTLSSRALARLGRYEAAHHAAGRALEQRPGWIPALLQSAMLSRRFGDRAASTALLQQVLDSDEATPAQLKRVATGFIRLGDAGSALQAAERLAAITPRLEPGTEAIRAVALWRLRRRDEAEEILAGLRERDQPGAQAAVVYVLARTGRALQAREVLVAAGTPPRGRAAAELARMLRRDGHLDVALITVRDALEARPADQELRALAAELDASCRVFSGVWEAPTRSVTRAVPVAGRVLHVVGQSVPYAASGYAVRTDHTVRAQRAVGLDAQVVTQQGFPWDVGRDATLAEDVAGVPHHRLPRPVGVSRTAELDLTLERNIEALTDLVEQLRPAVLHAASDFRNALIGLAVAERFDLPLVYEVRGFWEDTWLAKRDGVGTDTVTYRWRRERETASCLRAAEVVTLAEPMREDLIARGVPAERITLAPNAVDPEAFGDLPRDEALAEGLGIEDGEVVVGYISSFVAYEGIEYLVAAIAQLRDQGLPVRGLLVGDGEMMPDLRRQVAALGLEDVVLLTGRVPHADIRSYYSLLDVFVVPRTNARVCQLVSPLKPYEAMASSRAMVVSGTPVLRSIIAEGVTGVSFAPEDAGDLATRIGELVADPDRRAALGAAAREHVLAHHTWRRNAERYLGVYERLGVVPART